MHTAIVLKVTPEYGFVASLFLTPGSADQAAKALYSHTDAIVVYVAETVKLGDNVDFSGNPFSFE